VEEEGGTRSRRTRLLTPSPSFPSFSQPPLPPTLQTQISKVAMLASKDVRVITASLSSASLLELQEVPKSAERLPARTFYLWHVDLARSYTALISHLYKTMANLIQRRKFEVGKMEALIEKRNRTDVKESEGELLSREDKAEIKRLDEVVEKLTLAEQRTGELRARSLSFASLSSLRFSTRVEPFHQQQLTLSSLSRTQT